MYYAAVTGRCVDHSPASCRNTYMAVYYHNIAGLNIIKVGDLRIASHIAPAGRSKVALTNTYLIQTPVHKAGTVKCIGSLGSPYVRASKLGGCNGYQG